MILTRLSVNSLARFAKPFASRSSHGPPLQGLAIFRSAAATPLTAKPVIAIVRPIATNTIFLVFRNILDTFLIFYIEKTT